MAQILNAVANGVGLTETLVYQVPATRTSMLLGALLTNVYGAILPVSLKVRKATADTHIVKDRRIGPGEAVEVVQGKIVLMAGDKVYAQAADNSAFDVFLSIAEGI